MSLSGFHFIPKTLVVSILDRFGIIDYLNRNKNVETDFKLSENIRLYYYKISDYVKNTTIQDENLGDFLSTVIVSCFVPVERNAISSSEHTVYGIGSILGFRLQNAVVWGSGILSPDKPYLIKNIKHSKYDIRVVRGPKTREQLLKLGKKCPQIYGDPAVLMPRFFCPCSFEKKHKVTVVFHHSNNRFDIPENTEVNTLSILTKDYKSFIEEIVQSERVVSSSLHGIILAEAYGIPAVLLLHEGQSMFKYEDWYYSTGRYSITVAHSIAEAMRIVPMDLPELTAMQNRLIDCFPYDLWD